MIFYVVVDKEIDLLLSKIKNKGFVENVYLYQSIQQLLNAAVYESVL